ncbi:PepSY domain-containing protein [Mycolicibacterium moriokaense]|nr:PepSY domain-containing protein [Mycolicibacterium moriokaense]
MLRLVSRRALSRTLRLRRLLVGLHRWTALVLGLLLVVVSTSGALVVYAPELLRTSNSELFHSTPAERQVDFTTAIEGVQASEPDFEPAEIALKDGVFMLTGADSELTYFVDAGTGELNGSGDLYGGVVGFLENLHDCGLTCEEFAGYTPWLAAPSALAGMTPFAEMTWGALLLALAGLAAVLLVITAPFIWWPGLRKLPSALRVRWRRSRFARDFDLHNLIGIVALVPLLVWGLTGLNFEVPGFRTAWDAVTGGQSPPEDNYSMETSENPEAAVTLDDAMTAAIARFPGSRVTWVGMPSEDAAFYSIDLLDGGPNLWAHNAVYEGNRSVGVDAGDAGNVRVFLGPSPTLSNAMADEWAQPALHYGTAVNGYWRALWFALGLTPLLLFLTGLSTWLYRKRVTRRRRAGQAHVADGEAKETRTE